MAEPAPKVAEALPPEIEALSPKPYPNVPPPFVIRSVIWLRKQLLGLANRLVPAEVAVFERTTGAIFTQAIGAIARHRIADLLADGPLTTAEIAHRIGRDPDAVHRLMRGAATVGIFTMDASGRCRNNRSSEALRSNRLSAVREFAEYFASKSNYDAWGDFEGTLRTGKGGFPRVHGMSVWDWFDAHPDERECFARAMMGMTVGDAPVVAKLFPWKEVEKVCDVGGGRGTLLSELLVRHSHLRGVLCDGAGVIQSARQLLERRGVAERVELEAGNFFEKVPAGADAYLLKNVLHDWDDASSERILKVCRLAMQPGARLVVVEALTPKNGTESFGNLSDLQMMVVCDEGRERSREDFARLFEASGYKPGRVFESPTVSVIEAIAN
jgi:hypothetical protein